MTEADEEQSQSGYEDGAAGPGAPTPLSALEVRSSAVNAVRHE